MKLSHATTPPLVRVDSDATPDRIELAHREDLRRLMIADPDGIDAVAVFVQTENLRRARFKSGAIPVSDALLRALPSIRARMTGIWGGRDAFVGPYVEERRQLLASFQPDLDFRVIEGAGHWVVYEAADQVNAVLVDMLRAKR